MFVGCLLFSCTRHSSNAALSIKLYRSLMILLQFSHYMIFYPAILSFSIAFTVKRMILYGWYLFEKDTHYE